MMRLALTVPSLALAAFVLGACNKNAAEVPPPGESADAKSAVTGPRLAPADKPPLARAQASVAPLGQSKVVGTLVFSALPDNAGVRVQGAISGLTPGKHGIHVHQLPDCSAADGSSAGGHFNPTQAQHGALTAAASHVGDLGNLEANAEGRADIDVIKKAATLDDGPTSYLQHSIVVHAEADDLHSQPAGAAGGRVGCGVIQAM